MESSKQVCKYFTQNAWLKWSCIGQIRLRKGSKNLSRCVEACGRFCNSWSITLPNDGLDIHSWASYEEKGVHVCQNLKMTLYCQINPISH